VLNLWRENIVPHGFLFTTLFIQNSNWARQQLGRTSLGLEGLARDAAVVLEVSLPQSVYKHSSCLGITPTSPFPVLGHVGIPNMAASGQL